MTYISKHLWGESEITADIWNGRWTRHMWEDALTEVEEKVRTQMDIKLCRKWLKVLTSKLFETQSALSRHRFKLSKRLKDPMFERSPQLPVDIQQRILEQYKINANPKSRKMDTCRQQTAEQYATSKRKRKIKQEPMIADTHVKNPQIKKSKRQKITHTKTSQKEIKIKQEGNTPKSHNTIKKERTTKYRNSPTKTHKLTYNINSTGKLGHKGAPINRGWNSYMRLTQPTKHKVGLKQKREDGPQLQPNKRQR